MARWTIAAAVAALALLGGCGGSQSGQTMACEQEGVKRAPGGRGDATLLDIDAATETEAWAAGDGQGRTSLVVRWNGEKWARVPSPRDLWFRGVAAVAADDVWAFSLHDTPSRGHAAVWHWDGASWVERTPPQHQYLAYNAIEAVATDDVWLVGTRFGGPNYSLSYIAHWDGRAWSELKESRIVDVVLEDVYAYAPDAVWAVGNRVEEIEPAIFEEAEPVVLRWDGTAWRNMPAPRSTGPFDDVELSNVAATGADEIWSAAGFISEETLLHWDGNAWTRTVPPFESIGSLAAESGQLWAAGVTSVGDRAIARLDGEGWTRAAVSPSTSNDAAWGLVALPDDVAIAVGREAVIQTGCIED